MDRLTELALAARRGDAGALDELIEAAWDPLWQLCAALVDLQSADDLAQEALTRAVAGLRSFRGEASVRTWLAAIGRHVCADELRRRARRRRRQQELAGVGSPEVTESGPDGPLAVADLIHRLDSDRRTAFVLTQVVGLSYSEAAAVCACPVGTIRSRVARARQQLLDALEGATDAGEATGAGEAASAEGRRGR